MERHNDPQPINIGTGDEITIKDLVHLIADEMGYKGHIFFDPSKPDGQPRRCLDVTRAWDRLGFKTKVSFKEGIKKTIEWFRESYDGRYDKDSDI